MLLAHNASTTLHNIYNILYKLYKPINLCFTPFKFGQCRFDKARVKSVFVKYSGFLKSLNKPSNYKYIYYVA